VLEAKGSPPPDSRTAIGGIVALALLVILWAGLVVWMSPTFRGSDQVWYVEDVRTVMAGGPAQTHEVYPFSLIGPDRRFDRDRSFVHDVPVLWVWAATASATGGDAHTGILLVNMLCCLGAAGFVYLASRRFVSRAVAACAAIAMLYMPVVFWIAGQDLAEPFSALLIAAAAYVVVRWPQRLAAWFGAEALLALAALGRVWTLPLLVVLPLGILLLDEDRPWPRRSARAAAVIASGAILYLPLSLVFLNYAPATSLLAILDVSLASNNMVLYLTTAPARSTNAAGMLASLVRNAYNALRSQFSLGPSPFMLTRSFPAADLWPVNLTVVLAASGLFLRGTDRLRRCVMALAVVAFGIHVTAAILLQNAPRYVVPVLPLIVLGAAVAAGLWLERGREQRWVAYVATGLLCITLASFVAVDVANARYFRGDALVTEDRRESVAAEPITDVDTTAIDPLCRLLDDLAGEGIDFGFAELKHPVREHLDDYGLIDKLGEDRLYPTLGSAVHAFVRDYGADWVDWEDAEDVEQVTEPDAQPDA
jgi:4-amino-4-deoxy-L-arabinose transferase-like glycosyltransferase